MNGQSHEKLLQSLLALLQKCFTHVIQVAGQLLPRKGLQGSKVTVQRPVMNLIPKISVCAVPPMAVGVLIAIVVDTHSRDIHLQTTSHALSGYKADDDTHRDDERLVGPLHLLPEPLEVTISPPHLIVGTLKEVAWSHGLEGGGGGGGGGQKWNMCLAVRLTTPCKQ